MVKVTTAPVFIILSYVSIYTNRLMVATTTTTNMAAAHLHVNKIMNKDGCGPTIGHNTTVSTWQQWTVEEKYELAEVSTCLDRVGWPKIHHA